jgi:hypothetical protein
MDVLHGLHLPCVGERVAAGTVVMDAEDHALQSVGPILGRETSCTLSYPEANAAQARSLEAGVPSGAVGSETAGQEARGDILLALKSGMSVMDVSACRVLLNVANQAVETMTDSGGTVGQRGATGVRQVDATWVPYSSLGKLATSLLSQLG